MKLWLQVLFAQGYLWRDRFPDWHAFDDKEPPSISWACLGGGAGIALNGVIHLASGSHWVGSVIAAWGFTFMLSCASPLLVRLLPKDDALRVSLAWVPGLVFVLLAPPAIVLTALNVTVFGFILITIPFAFAGSLFNTFYLREIQTRYLFFADPRHYASLLTPQGEEGGGLASLLVDTYWHLPRHVITTMLGSAKPYEGGA